MYLSRLTLNLNNRLVRRDLANCQELHRTLLRAFPQSSLLSDDKNSHARQDFGLLYRIESKRNENSVKVHIQSRFEPQWSLLPENYCETEGPNFIMDKYQRLTNSQILLFSLKANPTQKTASVTKTDRLAGIKNNGRRKFIDGTDEQIQWLARKGQDGGFKLLSVRINPEVYDVDVRTDFRLKGKRILTIKTEKRLNMN